MPRRYSEYKPKNKNERNKMKKVLSVLVVLGALLSTASAQKNQFAGEDLTRKNRNPYLASDAMYDWLDSLDHRKPNVMPNPSPGYNGSAHVMPNPPPTSTPALPDWKNTRKPMSPAEIQKDIDDILRIMGETPW